MFWSSVCSFTGVYTLTTLTNSYGGTIPISRAKMGNVRSQTTNTKTGSNAMITARENPHQTLRTFLPPFLLPALRQYNFRTRCSLTLPHVFIVVISPPLPQLSLLPLFSQNRLVSKDINAPSCQIISDHSLILHVGSGKFQRPEDRLRSGVVSPTL